MNARPETFRSDSKLDSLRVPPQSVEAEQSVLGGLMLAPESLERIGDLLTEEDFYRRDHRLIYRAILELDEKRKPFDAVTLGEWFEANKLDEQINGTGYLIQLASNTPSAANIRAYAEIVADKSLLRKLIEEGTAIVNDGFSPNGAAAGDVVSAAQQRLSLIGGIRGTGGFEPPKAALKSWWGDMQKRYDAEEWLTGLSTPYTGMDELTFGLQAQDLIILAGRPAMGKTVGGGEIATHVAQYHGPVAVYSLEMSRKQLLQRQIARIGRVPHEWLRSPKKYQARFPHEDCDAFWSKVSSALKILASIPLMIDESAGLTIDQIVLRARRLHREHPLKLVVIDHLHKISLPGRNTADELAVVSGKLKGLAKELDIPVLALAQLNRGNKDRTDKRPNMTDLRAAGAIEQDADEIWFLHREDYYDKKTHLKKVVELINGKSRNAPSGETVYLYNRFDQMRMKDWVGKLPEAVQPAAAPRRGWQKGGKEAAAGSDS